MAYKYGGYGIEKDLSKATSYFQMSADTGYAGALCKLAEFYYEGVHFEKDVAKAVELYKQATAEGNEQAKKWLLENNIE